MLLARKESEKVLFLMVLLLLKMRRCLPLVMRQRGLFAGSDAFSRVGRDPRILAAFQAEDEVVVPAVLDKVPEYEETRRPPTLPSGKFRPKQSLGQNYLSDQNYAAKIANSVVDGSPQGETVVELGPGLGALTRVLLPNFPKMMAVEIDGRAVDLLKERYPTLAVVRADVLEIDYTKVSQLRGGLKLNIIGNLPFYITSQILFTLCDHCDVIDRACVTMQWEVAQRLVAKPRTKDYGILSVVFQLYAKPEILFKIPNTAFYPKPKVTSALVAIGFAKNRPTFPVDPEKLRLVITTAFRQRRKMLRQSLKPILNTKVLPEIYASKRPEELTPPEFLKLTGFIFGFRDLQARHDPRFNDSGRPIWRRKGDHQGRRQGEPDYSGLENREDFGQQLLLEQSTPPGSQLRHQAILAEDVSTEEEAAE